MNPTLSALLPFVLFVFGVICRVFLPWLIARRDDPTLSWSWRYIWPQLVTAVIVLILVPLFFDLDSLGTMKPIAAYLSGWAAADVGREVDKFLVKALRKP